MGSETVTVGDLTIALKRSTIEEDQECNVDESAEASETDNAAGIDTADSSGGNASVETTNYLKNINTNNNNSAGGFNTVNNANRQTNLQIDENTAKAENQFTVIPAEQKITVEQQGARPKTYSKPTESAESYETPKEDKHKQTHLSELDNDGPGQISGMNGDSNPAMKNQRVHSQTQQNMQQTDLHHENQQQQLKDIRKQKHQAYLQQQQPQKQQDAKLKIHQQMSLEIDGPHEISGDPVLDLPLKMQNIPPNTQVKSPYCEAHQQSHPIPGHQQQQQQQQQQQLQQQNLDPQQQNHHHLQQQQQQHYHKSSTHVNTQVENPAHITAPSVNPGICRQPETRVQDFVILHADDDETEARAFRDHLLRDVTVEPPLTVEMFHDFGQNQMELGSLGDLPHLFNFILIFVTVNLASSKHARFKTEILITYGLKNTDGKHDQVVPVWASEGSKDKILELSIIKGVAYYRLSNPSFIECMKKLIIHGRKKSNRQQTAHQQ